MTRRFYQMAVILGLLSAIGPFAIDMYLPALPNIGRSLDTDIATAQMSLTVFFIAIGIGQLLYGPLADALGRKPPLYAGLLLFGAASVGCALAGSAQALLVFRFLQGLGAAAGMAIPRAVVRDLHTGHEAARLMSLLMLVFSISPILAPLAGSGLIGLWGWRSVFWFVALAAVAGVALVAMYLPETWGPAQRSGSSLGNSMRAYGVLLRDRHFLGLVFIGGFTMSGFFTYLVGSSFVMIDHFGLTPARYSLAFALNAIAFFGMAQFNGVLGRRFGLATLVRVAAAGGMLTLLASTIFHLSGGNSLPVLIAMYFVSSGFFALVVPNTVVLAMDAHGPVAGAASALMGTLQMLTGALAMGLASQFTDGTPLRMVASTAICAGIALLLTMMTLGGPRRRAARTGE